VVHVLKAKQHFHDTHGTATATTTTVTSTALKQHPKILKGHARNF